MSSWQLPADLWEKVRQIVRHEMSSFARSGFLRNASITGGAGLSIRDGGKITFSGGGGIEVLDGGDIIVQGGTVRITTAGDLVIDPDGAAQSSDFVAGATGWRLTGDSAEFNDLILRGGIIGNDALANPVDIAGAGDSQSGFSVTTTATLYAQAALTVPEGYTRAIIQALATATAANTSADADFLYVRAVINAAGGGENYARVAANGYGTAAATAIRTLTGLVGGQSIPVGCRLRTNNGSWPAFTGNISNIDAIAIFLR